MGGCSAGNEQRSSQPQSHGHTCVLFLFICNQPPHIIHTFPTNAASPVLVSIEAYNEPPPLPEPACKKSTQGSRGWDGEGGRVSLHEKLAGENGPRGRSRWCAQPRKMDDKKNYYCQGRARRQLESRAHVVGHRSKLQPSA